MSKADGGGVIRPLSPRFGTHQAAVKAIAPLADDRQADAEFRSTRHLFHNDHRRRA